MKRDAIDHVRNAMRKARTGFILFDDVCRVTDWSPSENLPACSVSHWGNACRHYHGSEAESL